MTTQYNDSLSLAELEQRQDFIRRHIGPNDEQTQAMLHDIGAESVDALIDEIVPSDIRLADLPAIEESKTEVQTHEMVGRCKPVLEYYTITLDER